MAAREERRFGVAVAAAVVVAVVVAAEEWGAWARMAPAC